MAKRIVNKHSLVKCKTIRPDQIEFGEISVNAHEHGPFLNVKSRTGEIIRVGGVVFSPHQPCAEKGAWWVEERPGGEHALWVFNGDEWILLLESIEGDGVINWDDITGIPDCFPACEHTHPAPDWGEIPGKPDCFPACEHTHPWDQVTDKPDCFEPCEHTHPVPDWGEIPGKPDCFPACEHTHPPTPWPDIPEKPDCFEPCEHTHPPTAWPDIPEKPDCFEPCPHRHDASEIDNLPEPPEPIQPNDGKLTIKDSDGATVGEFTANQAGNTDVTLPKGFSGDYNDLINQPIIPDPFPEAPADGNVYVRNGQSKSWIRGLPYDIRTLPELP